MTVSSTIWWHNAILDTFECRIRFYHECSLFVFILGFTRWETLISATCMCKPDILVTRSQNKVFTPVTLNSRLIWRKQGLLLLFWNSLQSYWFWQFWAPFDEPMVVLTLLSADRDFNLNAVCLCSFWALLDEKRLFLQHVCRNLIFFSQDPRIKFLHQ